MKYSVILVVICLSCISTVSVQSQPDSTRIIFTKDQPVYFDMMAVDSLRRFTPTIADTEMAMTLLAKDSGSLSHKIYYRQFAGLIIEGKKMLYINAFCDRPSFFETNTYYPKGGGSCFYRALVDVNEKKIVAFAINAPL